MQAQIHIGSFQDQPHLYNEIFRLTADISRIYPDYAEWYHKTFLPDLYRGNRICVIAVSQDKVVGCSLLKNTPQEQKICTLFVDPRYRRQGIGHRLLKASLKKLPGQPIITVSEKVLNDFLPLLTQLGFRTVQEQSPKNGATNEICFQYIKPVMHQSNIRNIQKIIPEKIRETP